MQITRLSLNIQVQAKIYVLKICAQVLQMTQVFTPQSLKLKDYSGSGCNICCQLPEAIR